MTMQLLASSQAQGHSFQVTDDDVDVSVGRSGGGHKWRFWTRVKRPPPSQGDTR